ncbi:uncharacterized protein LOC143582144 [Bidens hawaiensis]|uniref:uncharacterized protein LOC143580393 n=1 Tax=Bidens hawaiensis TaxID=980011 RepID=UPI0040499A68
MQWIKAFQDHKVDLVGDEIAKGKDQQIQILYEYGITSTYLQGIKDPNMMSYEHMSRFPNVSFHVPFHQKEQRIQGLHVSCLYKSSGSNDKDMWTLLMKINNTTKDLTWVYNPLVYCKPRVDEDVVWLSYWPIGNILDAGDEVHVDIIVDERVFVVSDCGVSLGYMDDGEENYENNTMMKEEEVIGGDLSEFKVTTGGYYLCRRDLFGSKTSTRFKRLFDDHVDYPESQGWRKHRPYSNRSWELKYNIVVVLTGVNINNKSEINKIVEAVSSLVGVESVSINSHHRKTEQTDTASLLVVGYVYPVEVEACVKEFDTTAFISSADLY